MQTTLLSILCATGMFGYLRPCCRNACLHGSPLGAPGELGRGSPGPALLEVRSFAFTWSPGAVKSVLLHCCCPRQLLSLMQRTSKTLNRSLTTNRWDKFVQASGQGPNWAHVGLYAPTHQTVHGVYKEEWLPEKQCMSWCRPRNHMCTQAGATSPVTMQRNHGSQNTTACAHDTAYPSAQHQVSKTCTFRAMSRQPRLHCCSFP
ncbi:hypothetical protein COO60DRAFT_1044617 [Scenedesmus sp. NREL 46B-D3]|nr:hypothetical protein COO60DRAFT_1044617 [Scenedesmus sp. NREL 46B-D3]